MNASKNYSKKQATRELTHRLEYSKKTDSWSCKCGYVLGQGHDQLYARCEAYHQTQIPSGVAILCGDFGCKRVALTTEKIKPTALDLFDLAPPTKEETPHVSKKKKRKSGHA